MSTLTPAATMHYSSGLVLSGSRNVFTVIPDDSFAAEQTAAHSINLKENVLECRLKGKVLKGMEDYYNPLAPGDRVTLEADPLYPGKALITGAQERRTLLTRFNQKGQKSQILAANIDVALCMTTVRSPPFRPRFIDRVLVQAERAAIMPVLVCNKWDLAGADDALEERLSDYVRIGYRVLRISAKTGAGLQELRTLIAGKTSAVMGQSGVGKTSLINTLSPGLSLRTGALNKKHDRGNHTTALSLLLPLPGFAAATFLIDTPGIRRMVVDGVIAKDLPLYMKEFAPFAGTCSFGLSCSHRREPGCAVLEAADKGLIHPDRYESFLRIGDELAAIEN